MSDTRFGTFDELLADAEAAMRPVAFRFREVILAVDSDAVEVVWLGDRAATYGLGPRKMIDGYCYGLPHRGWVNLVRTLEAADQPAIRALIQAARTEREAALRR